MGALEANKRSMFPGLPLEGCETAISARYQYASKLEAAMPQEKPFGVQSEVSEAEDHSHKTPPATWLSQVGKDWESFLYKHALEWRHQALPADVEEHLAGFEEMVGETEENKWFSLAQFKSAWQM